LAGGKTLEITKTAYLKLSLATAAGPVNIVEPVECLVLDTEDEEFLLGKDVLAALGIDIERQLELLAAPGRDEDGDEKEDPVIGDDAISDADVRRAVESMIQEAFKGRLPSGEDRSVAVDRLRV
jgi:hypothetical protein